MKEGEKDNIIIIMFLFCVDYWDEEGVCWEKGIKSNSMGKR